MTDLLEKLRMIHEWKIGNEAADEIERLRAAFAPFVALAQMTELIQACEKVARIWNDMQNVDGDKRGHYHAFDQAVERMTTAAIRAFAAPDMAAAILAAAEAAGGDG